MKKRLTVSIIAFVTTLFVVGCSSGSTGVGENKGVEHEHIEKEMTLKEVHDTIVESARAHGWRVTEFKENVLIAEKIGDDETTSVTVSFAKDHFALSPENDDLEDILEDALED
jgi:PBP1b-binding outer membrane lipoprotein LpoB